MGFFDEMLAGGLAGAGKGMSELGAMQEREADKQAQLQAQMDLKREMLAAQLESKKDLAEMRFGTGGGGTGGSGTRGGSGGGGSFVENLILNAKTPEEVDLAMRKVALLEPRALPAVANFFGKPLQETVTSEAPTTGDLARFDRGQQAAVPEAVTTTRNASYDKDEGAAALNRMIARLTDPGKYDDYSKGETGSAKLDAAKLAAKGKDPEEAAAIIQSYTGNQDQRVIDSKEEMNAVRIAAKKAAGGGGGGKPTKDIDIEKALTSATNAAGRNFRKPTMQEEMDAKAADAYLKAKTQHIANDPQVKALNEKLGRGAPATATATTSNKFAGFSARPVAGK